MSRLCSEFIRTHRAKQNSPLLQELTNLEIDTAQLGKIEKDLLQLKCDQVPFHAEILRASNDELIILCLANQIYEVLKDEIMLNEAMQAAEKKSYNKRQEKSQ
jgi:hypothetical protein